MINIQFEFYVLNYDCNKHKVEPFNIFRNCLVQEHTEKAVRKYLRNPKKFEYKSFDKNEEPIYGFDALVKEIDSIIRWQECGRCEYEVCVGENFTTEVRDILRDIDSFTTIAELKEELDKINKRTTPLKKVDCYYQAAPNMVMITHEVIRQYKEQLKKGE